MLEAPSALREESSALERMLLIKKAGTYGRLPSPDVAALAELTRERFFPKGSVLLGESEPVHAVYLIVEGLVEATLRGRSMGMFPSGAGIGGLGLLAGDTFGVDARAVEDTLALELEADAMFELFEDRFAILYNLIRELSRQIIEAHVKLRLDPGIAIPEPKDKASPGELDLVERIFFMRRVIPFQKASINTLAELSRALTQVEYPPGTALWRAGEVAPNLILLVDGQVGGSVPQGAQFRVGPAFPLGALEAVARLPRWHEAVAVTRVVGLQGPAETLLDVLEDDFELARLYLAGLAQALIRILRHRFEHGASLQDLVSASPEAPSATDP